MSLVARDALAEAVGLLNDWTDADGRRHKLSSITQVQVLEALGYPARNEADCLHGLERLQRDLAQGPPLLTTELERAVDVGSPGAPYRIENEHGQISEGRLDSHGRLPAISQPGYYQISTGDQLRTVAAAPAQAFGIADRTGEDDPHVWGLTAQVYALRGHPDDGVGDAAGTLPWIETLAAYDGDALALSPIHAMEPVTGGISPYSPSDRRFYNVLHAAPALVVGERAFTELVDAENLPGVSDDSLVDWRAAEARKWQVIDQLFQRRHLLDTELRVDLAEFRREGGADLVGFAAFMARHDLGAEAAERQVFAQWMASRSWQHVAEHAQRRGLRIGLIADLAVGFRADGAEAAAHPATLLHGLTLGAPPDAFNAMGQDWSITGYHPLALRRHGYRPFLELLRAGMRHCGAIRIDHILGLMRLWLIPADADPREGAYLCYPLTDLLRLLKLESWRHRCAVIGEDLGTVPPELRAKLARSGVLGTDVMMFARDGVGRFLPSRQWRSQAIATTTTHDLPSFAGWRIGRDVQWRRRLGQVNADSAAAQLKARTRDVTDLAHQVSGRRDGRGQSPAATFAWVAKSPAPLMLLPLEDALGEIEQPNLPGTIDAHPNWQRRQSEPLPEATIDAHLQAVARQRPRQRP
ncbi:4-alpha-glucanotransferase [Oleiagrimonas sp. C23AA]|uniref:4-alpha-glucanotransferase n=1 Tax=Oleiagrimonas sp. C23AA TaxID=2719047 RepID=UPI00141DBEFE|nr:4-alpha-glucanotransferase [Oleiagrimonas sp. C23AA]NII11134.1 4-alpha-glucanotransferase [Oleiagrimonas sp. C23AA]